MPLLAPRRRHRLAALGRRSRALAGVVALVWGLAACASTDPGSGDDTWTAPASDAWTAPESDAAASDPTTDLSGGDSSPPAGFEDAVDTLDLGPTVGDARTNGDDAGARVDDVQPPAPRLGEWPPPANLGMDRPAPVRVPEGYDAKTPLPLVVLLGGYDFSSGELDAWIGVSDHADEAGFILLMPDGTVDSGGSPTWNATETCCDYDGTGTDDSGWLQSLLAEAKARLAVDPTRVVLVGHSAGGFMAYRLACDAADQVSAVVAIAGSSWLDASKCAASRGVSVLQIHGLDDETMPFDGDAEAPGALEVLGRWAARGGCQPDTLAETGVLLDLVAGPPSGAESAESSYAGCDAGIEVSLWPIPGADHYPGWEDVPVRFTAPMLEWALAHPL